MARTLKTYRAFLVEDFQKQIIEIGQRVKPFQTNFAFEKISTGYESKFSDANDNKVSVRFYLLKSRNPDYSGYEIDFSVNGTSFGTGRKMEIKSFFSIISTVVECINRFIEKFNVSQLLINAYDKEGKVGQKEKIWREYVLQNITDTGFVVGRADEPGYIILQNNRIPPEKTDEKPLDIE